MKMSETTYWLNIPMTIFAKTDRLVMPGQQNAPSGEVVLVAQYIFMVQTWGGPSSDDYREVGEGVSKLVQEVHPKTEGLDHIVSSRMVFDTLVEQYGEVEGRRVEVQGGGTGQPPSDSRRWGADFHPQNSVHEEPTQKSLDNLSDFPATD